jgi:hypothetical protein
MPLGAFRLNTLGQQITTGRTARTITALANAQVDTAQSKFGGASALFDGNADGLSVATPGFNWGTGDFTVEAWIRHNAVADQQIYWDFRSSGSNHHLIYLTSSSKLQYFDGTEFNGTSTLSTNTWYHLAVSRSSGTLRIFLNGTQETSGSNSNNQSSTGTGYIGISFDLTASNSMNGWMDEIRVSNIARYTANFTAPTAAFTNDANTLLLVHCNGADASTTFTDDNA